MESKKTRADLYLDQCVDAIIGSPLCRQEAAVQLIKLEEARVALKVRVACLMLSQDLPKFEELRPALIREAADELCEFEVITDAVPDGINDLGYDFYIILVTRSLAGSSFEIQIRDQIQTDDFRCWMLPVQWDDLDISSSYLNYLQFTPGYNQSIESSALPEWPLRQVARHIIYNTHYVFNDRIHRFEDIYRDGWQNYSFHETTAFANERWLKKHRYVWNFPAIKKRAWIFFRMGCVFSAILLLVQVKPVPAVLLPGFALSVLAAAPIVFYPLYREEEFSIELGWSVRRNFYDLLKRYVSLQVLLILTITFFATRYLAQGAEETGNSTLLKICLVSWLIAAPLLALIWPLERTALSRWTPGDTVLSIRFAHPDFILSFPYKSKITKSGDLAPPGSDNWSVYVLRWPVRLIAAGVFLTIAFAWTGFQVYHWFAPGSANFQGVFGLYFMYLVEFNLASFAKLIAYYMGKESDGVGKMPLKRAFMLWVFYQRIYWFRRVFLILLLIVVIANFSHFNFLVPVLPVILFAVYIPINRFLRGDWFIIRALRKKKQDYAK